MKKLLSLILAIAMLGSIVALAQESTVLPISEPESVENTDFISDRRVVEGTVKSVSENQIEIDELVLNIDENTLVADADLVPVEVKEGDVVTAVVSSMTTRSLPPQSYAFYVIVKNPEKGAPLYMTVEKYENGIITTEDGNYEVTADSAAVEMYRTKNIVKAEELTKGSEIFVYADLMTMSIPALVNPEKIVIMSIASSLQVQEEEIIVDEVPDKMIVEGTVKSVSESQIEIDELILNIDENSRVLDADLVPVEVKEGDVVTAVVSSMTTRSLPPQNYAFYVIVKNPEKGAPLYMTVEKYENGVITTEDGNYEVTADSAAVEMYRTKNIVKAEELTKGSEIFVYADLMTMSIPALVNPEKIVVMSIAEAHVSENAKAESLHEAGVLLGTENGLELERSVTRAEAVALIQRTTASAKAVYKSDFEDVPETHWAYSNISWAAETKIVEGVGDNKFEPDRTVTGQELAMMLLNAQSENADFDKAFEIATEKGIVTVEDGISKEDALTRNDCAKMIYNYFNK